MAADKGLSPAIRERAQRNHSAILRALQKTQQSVVAELLGVDPSTVMRWRDDHLERLAGVLAACGLKVAPVGQQLVEPQVLNAYKVIVAHACEPDEPSGFGPLPLEPEA